MTDFQPITKLDDPAELAQLAIKHQKLLVQALEIAKQEASCKPQLIRDILATGSIEGLATKLQSKAAAISFRAEKFNSTWHSLIPWQYLDHATAEEQAESMIETVEMNVEMSESNSWPPLPKESENLDSPNV